MAVVSLAVTCRTGTTGGDNAQIAPFAGTVPLGCDHTLVITVVDENGTAVDVSGDTPNLTIVPFIDPAFTITIGFVISGGSNNIITVTLSDTESATLVTAPQRLQAFLKVTGAGGDGDIPDDSIQYAAFMYDLTRTS